MVRPEILEQLLNRIVTKGTAPISHYIGEYLVFPTESYCRQRLCHGLSLYR